MGGHIHHDSHLSSGWWFEEKSKYTYKHTNTEIYLHGKMYARVYVRARTNTFTRKKMCIYILHKLTHAHSKTKHGVESQQQPIKMNSIVQNNKYFHCPQFICNQYHNEHVAAQATEEGLSMNHRRNRYGTTSDCWLHQQEKANREANTQQPQPPGRPTKTGTKTKHQRTDQVSFPNSRVPCGTMTGIGETSLGLSRPQQETVKVALHPCLFSP